MPKPLFASKNDFTFRNWHLSGSVGGTVERYYTPHNAWADGRPGGRANPYAPAIAGLSAIVQKAQANGKRVRAIGSAWSLTDVLYSSEYMVDTQRLWLKQVGLTRSSVAGAFSGRRERLVFAQCGVQIKSLNLMLEAQGLRMPTSGASNGQTIAGAVATGTHGSNVEVGSMSDFVRGLHVIADGGRGHWLERASDPVVSDAFCDWLGATPVRDDALFEAALVGFGSFGIVHAVLFEAAPLSAFRRHGRWYDLADVRPSLTSRQTPPGMPTGAAPFHLSFVIDPYRTGPGERGAYAQAIYDDGPLAAPPPLTTEAHRRRVRSPDEVGLGAFFADVVPAAIPKILKGMLRSQFVDIPAGGFVGTSGQVFGDVAQSQGGTSTEIGVALADAERALDAVLDVANEHRFAGFVALRFVKKSGATLAFTRFPVTATIELPALDSGGTRRAYTRIFTRLREAGIAHTFHWGQQMPIDAERLTRSYPSTRIDQWLRARRDFLATPAARRTFSNDTLASLGLAGGS